MLRTGKCMLRVPGGFWTYDGCPTKRHDLFDEPHDWPTWSVTVQTINTMRKRGWIQYVAGAPRVSFDVGPYELTAEGRVLAQGTG